MVFGTALLDVLMLSRIQAVRFSRCVFAAECYDETGQIGATL